VLAPTAKWLIAAAALYLLFFFGLTDAGLIGPDEPRYASLGREMARSGDWVTPRLWGQPWFEKPPLLYWMIAAANLLGLGGELAPRLPVALTGAVFLLLYYRLLRAEFGGSPALAATIILGTSAGWVAFSHAAVTDLPMSAAFSAAMLLGLRWLSSGDRRLTAGAAFLLGLAVLAKGLVPLALSLPLFWAGRKRLKDWVRPLPLAAFFFTVAPWYVLCALDNGRVFLQEFFWRHHFARFSSGVLFHPEPFWFYIPVLLAGLFPWTPVLAPLCWKSFSSDARRRFLLLWVAFGFVFFSTSAGKLPGYLLPLFPALAALGGLALHEMKDARWVLAACCLMLLLIPVAAGTLPQAMAEGLFRTQVTGWHWGFAISCILMATIVWWLEKIGRRKAAMGLLLVAAVLGVLYVKVKALPGLDRLATARPLWRQVSTHTGDVCVHGIQRNWRYSLNYYTVTPLPECDEAPRPSRIEQIQSAPPFLN
jgi:4-amino-4-deoxy-L-arabinose transferase-like glycosyltransferase